MRVFLFMTILLINGCKSIDKNSSVSEFKELPIQTISFGSLYGNGIEGISKSNLIIKNQKDWESLVDKMNLQANSSLKLKNTLIDFSSDMIICVFDTLRNTDGFRLKIDKIITENNRTIINYQLVKPAPKDVVSTVITQPFYILKTKKNKKEEVIFTHIDN